MFIIAGPNGSGKTTASYTLLPEMLECSEFVNSDEFAKSLSPFDPSAASVNASRKMLQKIDYLMARGMDFCVETTLATRTLLGIIRTAQEKNYTVTIIYFWINSAELAISRVRKRVLSGGHNIPEETVRRRYSVGLKYFFDIYSKACDRWVLVDNSQTPFTVIAQGDATGSYVHRQDSFDKILKSIQ